MRPASRHPTQIASIVALALLFPVLSFAQVVPTNETGARTQAARQFDEGSRAFDRGDFAHAADAYELAYRLAPHVDSLWNAANALERAHELPRAATLYARYLREAPADARDRNVAAARLVSLAAGLGCIELHGSDIEQLAVDESAIEERVIYVSPGAHVVRAVVSGVLAQQTRELAAGQVVGLVFEAAAPANAAEAHPAPPQDRATPEARPLLPPRRRGVSPWFVAGGGALTAVAVTATVAWGLSALSALDTFDAHPTASNLATGQSLQARTNVLLGVSIGLGVMTTATAIWLVDWRGPGRQGVRVGVGVARAAAEWRF